MCARVQKSTLCVPESGKVLCVCVSESGKVLCVCLSPEKCCTVYQRHAPPPRQSVMKDVSLCSLCPLSSYLPLHHIISGTTHVKTISPDEESARNCGMNWAPAFFAPKNCKKYKCQSFFVVVCCRCYLLYWTWLIVIHISIHLYIYFYARFIQKPQVWFYILILYSSAVCVKKPLQYQL